MNKITAQRLLTVIISFLAIIILQFAFSSPGAEAQSGTPEGAKPILESGNPEGVPMVRYLPQDWAARAVSGANQPGDEPAPSTTLAPDGWQTILTEGFEGSWAGSAWARYGVSEGIYERLWGADSYLHHSGSYSAWPVHDGPDGGEASFYLTYPNDTESWMIYEFDLSDATDADIEFWLWRETESGYDFAFFGASGEALGPFNGAYYDGYQDWTKITFSLKDYIGDSSVYVAWEFKSDSSTTYLGPFVDDIVIRRYIPDPPTADFSGTPTSGTKPLNVNFTDQSTGSINSWLWDFGDGGSSTQANPSHSYTTAGQYTVKLTVSGPDGSDSKTRTNYINVTEPAPVADFSATPLSGTNPLDVSFTDQSTGVVSSYSWDFGDGGSSTQANPSHSYTTAGQYTVKLTVSGPGGSNSKTRTNYINVANPNQPPVADFSATPLFGGRPLNVSFTNLSTGDISSYAWTFGDGGSSTQPNPSHEYTANGSYTVSLTVSGPGGSNTKTQTNYISVTDPEPAPVAGFSGTPLSGAKPLTVNFSDESSGNITGRSWDFGDGQSSTQGSPSHTYNTAGDFTVKLTVSGPGGSNSKTETNYIHVVDAIAAPVADFSAAPRTGNRPLTVGFQNLSTGNISSYSWDFGDGGSSTQSRPVHRYDSAGDYTVKLTVSGPGGSNSKTRTNYIHVDDPNPPPAADFSGSPLSGRAPLTVNFTDQSTGVISSYAWNFGDGGRSTLVNPSHTFTSQGLYAVGLTVTGLGGSDSQVKISYINVLPPGPPPPVADFTADKFFGNSPLTVSFSDKSSGNVTRWDWSFGDGSSSTQRNPVHTYFPGVYTVTLVVSGPNGDSDTKEITRYIHVFDPTTTLDFEVDYNKGLEVTQGIQDLNNYVRLVAGKRTFVRFYTSANQGNHVGEAVMLALREGDSQYEILWPVNTASVGVLEEPNRGHIDHSFLFELPEHYTHGKVTLTAELNFRKKIQERSYSNNTAVYEANFEAVPAMELVLYAVGYGKGDQTFWPKYLHRTHIEDWLQRAYPVSDIKITHRTVFMQTIPDVLKCEDVISKSCDPGTLKPNTTYYWRVNTRDANGKFIHSGPVWHFTTGNGSNNLINSGPSKPSPANGATNQGINVNLSWSDTGNTNAVTYYVYFEAEGALPTCDQVNNLLMDKRSTDLANNAISADAHYYGMVDDGGGAMRGCAWVPGHAGSGPVGVPGEPYYPQQIWDTDGSYGDWYAGHELGHSYGRPHIYERDSLELDEDTGKNVWVKRGPCNAVGGERFPNLGGLISPFVGTKGDYYGFDIHSKEIYGPEWHDVMSYCDNQWISRITYESIMDFIQKPPILNMLNHQTALVDRLSVVGTIDPSTETVALVPLFIVPDADNPEPATPGPYAIVLRSTAGVELARYPFTPDSVESGPADPNSDEPDVNLLGISELVPYVEGTSRVDIEHEGTILSSITAGAALPQVTVTTPNGGETLAGDTIHVAWTASDPDNDDVLVFNVQYSANGGQQWETVAYYLSATEVDIDATNIPGSDQGLFRVLASDGVHTAYDESDAVFTVPNRKPAVSILEPADGVTVAISQTVGLRASAYDVDTGTMAAALLHWSSNRDGELGSGQQLSVADLSVGVHTITFRADDGQGGVAEEQVQITVLAEAPTPADKLIAGPTTIILDSSCGRINPTLSLTNQNFQKAIGWTAVTSEPWLKLSAKTGSTPANLVVSFDPAGLDPDTYTAEITFSSPATPGNSAIVPVTLKIVENGDCAVNLPFIIGYPGQ